MSTAERARKYNAKVDSEVKSGTNSTSSQEKGEERKKGRAMLNAAQIGINSR